MDDCAVAGDRASPSVSCLFYLLGDRRLGLASRRLGSKSVVLPCSRTRVVWLDLAACLICVALWRLRGKGAVSLRPDIAAAPPQEFTRIERRLALDVGSGPFVGVDVRIVPKQLAGADDHLSVIQEVREGFGVESWVRAQGMSAGELESAMMAMLIELAGQQWVWLQPRPIGYIDKVAYLGYEFCTRAEYLCRAEAEALGYVRRERWRYRCEGTDLLEGVYGDWADCWQGFRVSESMLYRSLMSRCLFGCQLWESTTEFGGG